MNKHNSASCLCGGVQIEVKGKLRYVSNCHCSQCMKTHGNFGAYTSCKDKDLILINKQTLKWYQSSSFAKRGFCFNCGSSIFFKNIKNNYISISAGVFQNPTKLKTKHNIFTLNKMDYYDLDQSLPKFDKYSK